MEVKNEVYLKQIVDYSRQLFDLSGKNEMELKPPGNLEALRNSGMPNIVVLLNFVTMKVRCVLGNVEQVVGCPREELHGQSIDTFYGLMTPKHRKRFSNIGPELSENIRKRVQDGSINDHILNIQNQIRYPDARGRNKWVLAQAFHYFISENERVGVAIQMTDISSMVIHSTFHINLYHKVSEKIVHSFSDPESIHLTKREREIMEWLYQGKMEKEIAAICSISLKTVKNHKQNVFKKLGVSRTVEATHKLEELGLL